MVEELQVGWQWGSGQQAHSEGSGVRQGTTALVLDKPRKQPSSTVKGVTWARLCCIGASSLWHRPDVLGLPSVHPLLLRFAGFCRGPEA